MNAPAPLQAVVSDTANRILDVAERLVQTRGFNGFSYADIAAELGITKASLHHHFATKAELGRALIVRYSETFGAALQAIDAGGDAAFTKLTRYAKLYEDVLRAERLCLCGMLAAEYGTLPEAMQQEIRRFFDENEAWLTAVIENGRRTKTLHVSGTTRDLARMLLGSLEGAMLVARPYNDVSHFARAVHQMLSDLKMPRRKSKAD